jgi:hypothetical protein
VCVCALSLRRESPDMILGDKPLIFEVVLSHRGWDRITRSYAPGIPRMVPHITKSRSEPQCHDPAGAGPIDLDSDSA